MVEAVSSNPTEGEQFTVSSIEEAKVEEAQKKELTTDISSKECIKKFIEQGGDQLSFQKVLKARYGQRLVERMFPKGWPRHLSSENCYEIIQRIGQGITLEDLEDFYAELKSGQIKSDILKETMVPYLRMWWAGSVRDLPPYWFGHFVELFQTPFKTLEIEEKKILCRDSGSIHTPHYVNQVAQLIERGDRTRPEFYFASRELLAKTIAYARPSSVYNGSIIPLFNQELGRVVYYTLKGQVHDNGLHAYLYVPIEKGDFPAQLIFRGTNGYASTGRDLDAGGIGKRVFQANKEKIETLIKEAKTERVEVIGHSLGAADAQRGIALLVEPARKFAFKEVSLFAFCAPRLEIERVNQWKADLKTLAETNNHPTIRLNFAHHESDVVTWTGDSYLSGAELDFIYSNYLTVRSKSGPFHTPAHHTTSFFKNGNFDFETDERTFEFKQSFPNTNLEGELRKLEQIQNAWQWWRGVKSYFVKVETKEEIEARIEEMKAHQADISLMEKGGSQHSWLVYSGWSAIRYTVQPIVYYTYEGIRSLASRRNAPSATKQRK